MRDSRRNSVTRRRLLRDGLITAGGVVWGSWVVKAADLTEEAIAEGNSQSWGISNDRIERVVSFDPANGLTTSKLSAMQTDYIIPAKTPKWLAREFSFTCNGHTCAGTSAAFTLVSSAETTLANGKSLTLRLRHKELPLDVDAVYCVYDGHPALRKHLVLRNT